VSHHRWCEKRQLLQINLGLVSLATQSIVTR